MNTHTPSSHLSLETTSTPRHSPITTRESPSVPRTPSPIHMGGSTTRLTRLPTEHRWSEYTPYTLPPGEIRRLLRVAAVQMSTVLYALTPGPGICQPQARELQQFVEWMCREGKLDPTVLVATVAYLRAFVAVFDRQATCDWRYVVATALLVASKIVDDDTCDNKEVANLLCERLWGTTAYTMRKETLNTLNRWEVRFLRALDYRVHISHDDYTKLWRMLAEGSPVDALAEPVSTSPTSVADASPIVPCTKPHPIQLLRDLCAATVHGWFVGGSPPT